MSCDYCCGGKNMMRDSCSDVSIGKDDDVYRIYYSDGYRGGATNPIRFCPMCGERFPEVVRDSFERIKADMRLDTCIYVKKYGIGHGASASNEQAACASCEWAAGDCELLMRMDLSDRLSKLLDEEDGR